MKNYAPMGSFSFSFTCLFSLDFVNCAMMIAGQDRSGKRSPGAPFKFQVSKAFEAFSYYWNLN